MTAVRDAMRELYWIADALSGGFDHFVLCQNNQMRAVVRSLDALRAGECARRRPDEREQWSRRRMRMILGLRCHLGKRRIRRPR